MTIETLGKLLEQEIEDMRLYFTMKKGKKYITFGPSIEPGVSDDLLKLIKDHISNFREYENVEFSPVGYREGTVEICNSNYIYSFGDIIQTFLEDEVERDPINYEDINKLSFYCIKINFKDDENEMLFFRRVTKFKKLSSKGFFGSIRNNRFTKIDSDLIGVDGDIDIAVYNGELIIFNHIALERIFSLSTQYMENAQEAISIIKKADRISNFEQFEEDCLNDNRITRILTKMLAEEDDLENCFENFSNVINVINMFELKIDVLKREDKDIIIYEDKDQLMDVIRLVRDSYYKSIIRERTGIDDGI